MRTAGLLCALWLLPSIDREWGDACTSSLRVPVVMRVDNTRNNLGVARSWNLGVHAARGLGARWLILCSESMRFGEAGGCDLEEQLEGDVVTTFNSGWHLIALNMEMIHNVGPFDALFSPAYFEDADYQRRMELAGYSLSASDRVKQIEVDAHEIDVAHSFRNSLVQLDYGEQLAKYERKWGGAPGSETFEHPYDDREQDWTCVSD